jgi:hypothetical protein
MKINDLKCCGNCNKADHNEGGCPRLLISDYNNDPGNYCIDWQYDNFTYSQRMWEPYFNHDGN